MQSATPAPRSICPVYLGLITQNGVEKRDVDLDRSVVTDEAELTELIHEKTHPRSGRANHFGQCFLAYVNPDGLRGAFLAEVCQQQQQARQTLLTRIEKLIYQIFLNSAVARKQVRHEQFGELGLGCEHVKHHIFRYSCDDAIFHCGCSGNAKRMTIKAAFA